METIERLQKRPDHSGLELAILTIISEMANVEASTGRDCQKGLKSAFFYQFDTDSY